MAPSLCPLGSPRAEQLRRAVIYKLKDWGFPRPDATVLDRFVKLIDQAPPRYELEGSLPPLFPTSRPHPQFFDWLLKDALPKIVETNPSKDLAATVPSRMLETRRDRSKSDRSGSGPSGSDRATSGRSNADRTAPTPPVEPVPERSGSPLIITLERRNKRLVRRVGLAPEPGSAQPLQEPPRQASTGSLDGVDRRQDSRDRDRWGSKDRARDRESSRRDDDRKRDDVRKRSDDRRSRDHDRRRDDDRRRSDDRRPDEDRGRSSKSDRDSDKRRSESRRSSRSRDRSSSRGRSAARRAESPMSPRSRQPSSRAGSSVAPSRDTSRSSRHRSGRSRERSPDTASAASRGRSRDRPSHTDSHRHHEPARDSPKGFERADPGFGTASAKGSSLGPQSRGSRGTTGFPQEQGMPPHRQQQQLMQQQRQQQQQPMQHQRQQPPMQAQRQQPHLSHRPQQQGSFPNQQQQQFCPPGQFVGGRGGPGGPMYPRFQGNQGPRGPWPAQHAQGAPRPSGNQGGLAALNQAQPPVSQPPPAQPAGKPYAEQDEYRQEDEYEIPDELDGQATKVSAEQVSTAAASAPTAQLQEQAQAQSHSQPQSQAQTPLQTPPRLQGPAKPKLITDPQPIATYSASFAVRGTPAGPIYNYKYDISNDYLTRQCAYRDDFYAGHLLDRYVGPPGSLAPFPTSRNDSKSNPTCAILCTPYETGDAPSRCRHWPFCFYGQAARQPCKFWHPTAICADYPNCRYDDTRCPFIHPIFFPLVADPQSNLHGATLDFQGALQTIQLKQTTAGTTPVAAAGATAGAPGGSAPGHAAAKQLATSPHTSTVDRAAMATIPCKFGSKCTRKDCAYAHPHTSDRFSLIADDKAVERVATGTGWNNQSGGDLMELDVYGDDALMWQ